MNSIDEQAVRALTDPLFDVLIRGARAQPPFPLGFDPHLSTYYVKRTHCAMAPSDFLAPSCLNAAEMTERLAAYWGAAGSPELAARAPLVAETAHGLRALYLAAQPQAELSPYIYQMF